MKKFLTDNIGLKAASVMAAIILWIVVINVDDPVITRVFIGIPVEVTNVEAITSEGKTYEIAGGSETISVSVTAGRSVIEALSKENIKATADLKNLTFMNTVPIEVKSSRYADKINSISSRTASLPVIIENKKDKQLKIDISTVGEVAKGYVAGSIDPDVSVIKVSGPESKVNTVSSAQISVDFSDMNETFTTSCPIVLYDAAGTVIRDSSISVSKNEIRTSVEILESKEIPVTASFTGTPAAGYGATGIVICEPSSIVVAGKGSAFENLTSVNIPADVLLIDGASENKSVSVKITDYLPSGVILADRKGSKEVNITAVIEQHATDYISLPVGNITVTNLPKGYSAHIVSGDEIILMEISGLPEDLINMPADDEVKAQIDATALSPRLAAGETLDDNDKVHVGVNDGKINLILPEGVDQVSNLSIEVVINYNEGEKSEDSKGTEN